MEAVFTRDVLGLDAVVMRSLCRQNGSVINIHLFQQRKATRESLLGGDMGGGLALLH
jgi:hypothetical protein